MYGLSSLPALKLPCFSRILFCVYHWVESMHVAIGVLRGCAMRFHHQTTTPKNPQTKSERVESAALAVNQSPWISRGDEMYSCASCELLACIKGTMAPEGECLRKAEPGLRRKEWLFSLVLWVKVANPRNDARMQVCERFLAMY